MSLIILINILYCSYYLCCLFYLQNRALLDTLRKLRSTGGTGHIVIFNTLPIGHTKHPNEQRISCWPFAGKKLRGSNRQDFVFIRPPGISHGAFELRMDNVWFSCAFVSVLEEYSGHWRPGELLILLMILIMFILLMSLIILT